MYSKLSPAPLWGVAELPLLDGFLCTLGELPLLEPVEEMERVVHVGVSGGEGSGDLYGAEVEQSNPANTELSV